MLLRICLCFLLFAAFSNAAAQPAYDVIILGAGAAGLKAAYDLVLQNRHILLLEARGRPFGRIYSVQPPGWPVTLELGAQWFHGNTTSNAVLAYAQQQPGLPIINTGHGEDLVTIDTGKGSVFSDAVEAKWDDWFDAFEEVLPDLQEAAEVNQPLSTAVEQFMKQRGITAPTDRRGFLAKIETNYVQEYAASTSNLSLPYFNADSSIMGSDSVPLNYSSVFGAMVKTLQSKQALRLLMEVRRIEGTANGVKVTAYNHASKTTEYLTAKYVLSTLPLGVLKASYTTLFAADGPNSVDSQKAARKVAIDSLGMGLLNKVVMQFPSAFWKQKTGNAQWIETLPDESAAVQWTEFFSLQKATGHNILVAFQAGNSAWSAEALDDGQTLGAVMAALRAMFGPAVPNPDRYLVTRWSKDPYALGSYSYHKVGAAEAARTQLCRTAGRLYFAGEACSLPYPSTVQGAWLTGRDAATAIGKALRGSAGK